jgi:hyperosmotically inducible protein
MIVAAGFIGVLGATTVACSTTNSSESTGQYVDDSVISNKVRAQIVGDKTLSIFQIDVTTYKGIVQLSGFVDTTAQKAEAERIVSSIAGVKGVRNNLIVK